MIKKLRFKFIRITMLSVFLVLLVLIGAINIMNYRSISQKTGERLQILIDNSGQLPQKEDYGPGPALPADGEEIIPSRPDGFNADFMGNMKERDLKEMPFNTRFFTVTMGADGSAESADTGHIAAISADDALSYAKKLSDTGKESGYIDDYRYTVTIINGKNTYIFMDCSQELSSFRNFLFASIVISLSGFICVFLLVFFISSFAVRPIAESYEKQKRFITDASHEIKTPLAIISANNDVMEMENGETKWTDSNRHQLERLNSLTEKLVFLTRMDEENTPLMNKCNFSLSDAAADTIGAYVSMAKASEKDLIYKINSEINYHGDEAMIRQLMSLLMDNALKYSSNKGRINVNIKNEGSKKILMTFENTTDNIKKGPHNEFFERFYRGDKSRNSQNKGFGIGLSVCEAIVTAHNGKIKAESPDGKILRITVSL